MNFSHLLLGRYKRLFDCFDQAANIISQISSSTHHLWPFKNTAKWIFNGAYVYLSNDPSARVCATFGRRNGANEGETLDNNIL